MQAAAPASQAPLTALGGGGTPLLFALRVGNLKPRLCGERAVMKRSPGGLISISRNRTHL